ncbi:hypothetical protein GCM10010216_23000 [Streptomyces flaveolus]|nr:hypothetical protein GCM10010216_23000 [Streptomyces flaveolus]
MARMVDTTLYAAASPPGRVHGAGGAVGGGLAEAAGTGLSATARDCQPSVDSPEGATYG